jgi:hypothetical protein
VFPAAGAKPVVDPEATSAMIAKEQHKLEVLKRRQEREIQQMVQYEVTRKQLLEKQQKKIDALEVNFVGGFSIMVAGPRLHHHGCGRHAGQSTASVNSLACGTRALV